MKTILKIFTGTLLALITFSVISFLSGAAMTAAALDYFTKEYAKLTSGLFSNSRSATLQPVRSQTRYSPTCRPVIKPKRKNTETIYTWMDENGVKHYSNVRPLGVDFEIMSMSKERKLEGFFR